jgi:serine/threonine protein phosphatase PrpC
MKHHLPQKLESNLRINKVVKNTSEYPDYNLIKKSFHSAFEQTNDGVNHQLGVDVRFSGSTCVSVLTFGTKLFVANVGDSRAILIKQNDQSPEGFQVTPLSRDHKPSDPDEFKRIVDAGGRVDTYRDHKGKRVGPDRVWLLNEEIPGLAMSRSFGDTVACRVGVNAIPEQQEVNLTAADKVLVIASDGVWEFMEN